MLHSDGRTTERASGDVTIPLHSNVEIFPEGAGLVCSDAWRESESLCVNNNEGNYSVLQKSDAKIESQ